MALALPLLLTLIAGVASQPGQDSKALPALPVKASQLPGSAVVDPSSNAASVAGTGYSAVAPLVAQKPSSFANQDKAVVPAAATIVNPLVAAAATAGVPAPAPTSFNPLAMVAAPAAVKNTGITDVINSAINGDVNGVENAAVSAIAEVPTAFGEFVDGFIGGWFQKVVLETGEKTCIRNNVHKMATDGIGVLSTLAQTIMQVVNKATPNMFAIVAGSGQVVELFTTTQALLKQCVKQDVLAVMTVTFNHLKDPPYVRGRLLANSMEIMKTLADSVGKAEKEQWTQVGLDFGVVLRKALLSDDSTAAQMVLPPGMTQPEVAPAIVQGVIEGMFVQGTAVKIRSTADPSIQIFVNLHDCVAKEAKYVSMAMSSIYFGVAQLSTQIDKMKLAAKGIQTGNGIPGTGMPGSMKELDCDGKASTGDGMPCQNSADPAMNSEWMTGMSGLMSNIPVLMQRCGITAEQRGDMKKAFSELEDLKAAFTIPGPADKAAAATQASARMEQATTYWQSGQYKNFGIMTGGMLRDLLLTMFPTKPIATADTPAVAAPSQLYYGDSWERAVPAKQSAPASLAVYVGGFAAVTLLGMAILRAKPTSQSEHQPTLLQAEPEASDLEGTE